MEDIPKGDIVEPPTPEKEEDIPFWERKYCVECMEELAENLYWYCVNKSCKRYGCLTAICKKYYNPMDLVSGSSNVIISEGVSSGTVPVHFGESGTTGTFNPELLKGE